MPRNRGYPMRVGRANQHMEWTPFSAAIVPAGVSSIAQLIVNNAAGTILRLRARISCVFDGPTANDQAAIFWGIGVFGDDQVAAGATALPDPADQITRGTWFAFGTFPMIAAATVEDQGVQAQVYDVDSKAKRKFAADTSTVLVAQNIVLSGTPAFDMVIAGTCLAST